MKSRRSGKMAAVLVAVVALAFPAVRAQAWPDCTPDAVSSFDPAAPATFGQDRMPGVVLGFPAGSALNMGSLDVVSLGPSGSITLAFTGKKIVDRPGPDFIVFENAFFCAIPESSTDDYGMFAEPLIVEVSDGTTWRRFPFSQTALDQVGGAGCTPRSLIEQLTGLAGITPTYAGASIKPDSVFAWDPDGTGGVSGSGGDAFDLADVGLSQAVSVRLIDSGRPVGIPGAGQDGADLDAVIALHAIPASTALQDSDGDNLPDAEEIARGTNPNSADTDGDGMDDGVEAASCLCPQIYGDTLSGIDLDADNDQLLLRDEAISGTDPCNPDSDGDQMTDGWEFAHDLNPLADDAADDPDGDGLTNLQEFQHQTDPHLADTDGDGLSDSAELNVFHTNPLLSDTDGDGMTDKWETGYACVNPLAGDSTGDPDGEGLSNLQEFLHHTNPCLADTDGDNMNDLAEILKGRDPTVPDRPHKNSGGGGSSGGCTIAENTSANPAGLWALLIPLLVGMALSSTKRIRRNRQDAEDAKRNHF